MKGNYQKILLLATMVYIGNCLPIRKTRESEETIPAMNLISGFSATRQILDISTNEIIDTELKPILRRLPQLIEYSVKLKQLNERSDNGVEETSSYTLQAADILLDAVLRDACEWLKTREEVDHNLNCSNEDSLMEFLIPIAVIPQMDEVFRKLLEVADNEGGIDRCKWYYCNFSKECRPNISEQLDDFMYSKLNRNDFCTCTLESFSCDQCDGTYNS